MKALQALQTLVLYSQQSSFRSSCSLFHVLMYKTAHSARSISLRLAKKSFAVSVVILSGGLNMTSHAATTTPLHCDTNVQIKTSSQTIRSVEAYAKRIHCPKRSNPVCTVFDIDNTLITNDPNFGGEAWGSWQESLAPNDPNKISNVFSNTDIYRAEASLRFLFNFNPVEADTVTSLQAIQKKYPTIALTSLGFSSLATTERQLLKNGLDLSKNPIGGAQLNPYFLAKNQYKTELKMYYNGVYYVGGDSKGKSLLNLINTYRAKTGNPNLCQVVVILDDTPSKIDDIVSHIKGKIGFVAIVYTALPIASDSAHWKPHAWKKNGRELYQAIRNLPKN